MNKNYTHQDVVRAALDRDWLDESLNAHLKQEHFNVPAYARLFDFVTPYERVILINALHSAWQWGMSVTPKKTLHDQRKKAENMRRATGLSTFSEF